jgi:3',5'-cyclic AMP phosphodiesterase CpdA
MPAMLVAQLTDVHLRMGRDDLGSARALAAAVRALGALDPAPGAVLLTGDLTETGDPRAYARLRELLAPLRMDVHPIPGNHDDRDALREAFADHPGIAGAGPYLQYEARCGGLRVLLCDTLAPGGDDGRLDDERRAWLAAALDADHDAPTLIAMHHPPVLTGIDVFDEIGLPAEDREALAGLLRGRRNVLRVAAGHIHRALTGVVGGVPVVVAPSAWRQAVLDLRRGADIVLGDDRPGYALHLLAGDGIVSHTAVLAEDRERVAAPPA